MSTNPPPSEWDDMLEAILSGEMSAQIDAETQRAKEALSQMIEAIDALQAILQYPREELGTPEEPIVSP